MRDFDGICIAAVHNIKALSWKSLELVNKSEKVVAGKYNNEISCDSK